MQKIYYYKNPNGYNFGDDLTNPILKIIFNCNFKYTSNIFKADYIGIGSILDSLLYCENGLKNIYQIIKLIKGNNYKHPITLGCGFGEYYKYIKFIKMPILKILRGLETYNIIKENYNISQDEIIFGDLGILSSEIYKRPIIKKHKYGIIPHYNDSNSYFFFYLKEKLNNSIFINVRENYSKVIENIASCEYIISSSLHGLIVADSFNIPNIWVENSFKPFKTESRFKFNDYYSSFNIKKKPNTIDDLQIINERYIIDNNAISPNQIKRKKEDLILNISKILG